MKSAGRAEQRERRVERCDTVSDYLCVQTRGMLLGEYLFPVLKGMFFRTRHAQLGNAAEELHPQAVQSIRSFHDLTVIPHETRSGPCRGQDGDHARNQSDQTHPPGKQQEERQIEKSRGGERMVRAVAPLNCFRIFSTAFTRVMISPLEYRRKRGIGRRRRRSQSAT